MVTFSCPGMVWSLLFSGLETKTEQRVCERDGWLSHTSREGVRGTHFLMSDSNLRRSSLEILLLS